jgi:predicted anti-sigma-YlaC factor YlaD
MTEPRDLAAPCGRRFPEEHLSGWLDGALTQGEEQRVRIHLENCPACREEVAAMARLREIAMSTRFDVPGDDQWNEAPRTAGSRFARRAGWILALVWAVSVALFALWQIAIAPEGLAPKLIVFGGLAAAVLLFLSILLDRLRMLPGDRYRRVQR